MKPDDTICYCYHVSARKLINYSRRCRPKHASLMTECLSAGTGCGWCIPFLVQIADNPDAFDLDSLTPDQYAENRKTYITDEKPKNTFGGETA